VETSLYIKGSTGSGIKVRNVKVSGGKFESYGAIGNYIENADVSLVNNAEFTLQGYQGFLLNDNANVKAKRVKFIGLSPSSACRIMDLTGSNVQLDVQDIDIDITNIVATDSKLFRLSNANAVMTGDKVNVVTNGKTITSVFDSLGASTGTLKVLRVTVDQDVTILNDVNFNTLVYSFVTPTKSSAARFQDLSADNAVPIIKGINDDLFIRIKPLTSNKILGVFPVGVRLGQRLLVRNSGTSFSTTIKHGATYNTNIGADVLLGVDAVLPLFWDGTYWTKAN
jgi:hypothetical protein